MAKLSFTYKFSGAVFAVLCALVGTSLQSCMPRGTDEASTYAYNDIREVDFRSLSAAVLVPKCVQCHAWASTPEGVASTFIAFDPDHSPLYTKVASGEMPKGGPPLAPALVRLVRAYIANPPDSSPVIDLKNVTFEVLKSNVLDTRCIRCHDDFASAEGFMGDIEPGDADHSLAYNYVKRGKMPKNSTHLTDNNVEAFKVYINSLPPATYPPIQPTWTSINANLIQRSCIQCHTSDGSAKSVPFDTYQQIVTGVVTEHDGSQKSLLSVIVPKMQNPNKPMPPRQSTLPPSAELIRAVQAWINDGAKEN